MITPLRPFSPLILLACLLVLCATGHAASEPKAMPFNDISIFNYFKNVEEKEDETVRMMSEEEFISRRCALFVRVMGEAGYDFEATVKAAAAPTVSMGDKTRNPRYKFLAGVFQIHPKEFLARKAISEETYRAVMAVFEAK
jgi:hypothetical protein